MGRAKTILGMLAATTVLLAACGTNDRAEAEPELRHITYLTGFGAAGRDAYAWMAREKGYFREAGLDVEIKLGAALSDNLQALAAGQADFSMLDLVGGFIMAGQGKYTDFRAIAAVHQQTVVSIVTPADGPTKKPADLAGKTIGAATGSVNQALFPAYAKRAGLDPKSVRWVNASPQQVPALLAAGRVDALSTFLIGRPGIEKAAGKPMTVLPYEEFLPDLYGNGIVTSTKLLESDPDLVRRFREAAMKGLADTIADPKTAAALLHKDHPASSAEAAEAEIRLMTPYTEPLGELDPEKVTRAIKVLTDTGLFPAGLTAEQVIAS
ncbi:ABC transporter substrate-binding protein [Paractinoplanes lichenicola]|uniref:ABC transporter substrate-binding protein n=1 Tax=Paractinoplanes lichenicola TaxID=2802976 RepID=A0ABS1VFA4_9ACTN|nr:ABC transporter substrate-binding protein [Actinoplanes lichenicola]MBL7252839.1 ABC transporter substrate-binding protein [Actinoplanes lichenicola]